MSKNISQSNLPFYIHIFNKLIITDLKRTSHLLLGMHYLMTHLLEDKNPLVSEILFHDPKNEEVKF